MWPLASCGIEARVPARMTTVTEYSQWRNRNCSGLLHSFKGRLSCSDHEQHGKRGEKQQKEPYFEKPILAGPPQFMKKRGTGINPTVCPL